MQNSNEKSKCCDRCKDYDPCYKISCPCHKPSVEVSKCSCGEPNITEREHCYDGKPCFSYVEPQSIPLDRYEREIKGSAGEPISEKNFIGAKGGSGGLYGTFTLPKEIKVSGNNGSGIQIEEYKLYNCDKCLQMTNHLKGICQKCKPHPQEDLVEDWVERFDCIFDPYLSDKKYKTTFEIVKEFISKLLSSNTERVKKEERLKIAYGEYSYWIRIFDNPPKRNKPYPCDNCTQNISRIEADRWQDIINNIKGITGDRQCPECESIMMEKKYPEHFCANNDGECECECYNEGYLKSRAVIFNKIGFLRQWLNEDRIDDPYKMVDNDEIRRWFEL